MANERLRSAISAARVTVEEVAEAAEVAPKTVRRWINNGRRPYARNRWAVAKFLDEDERFIWPPEDAVGSKGGDPTLEVVGAYAHRAAVPIRSWWKLLTGATAQIDLLGYAMLHLPEQHPEMMDVLTEKGENGCSIRIALADPESSAARRRDEEEELDGGLLARIETATKYFGVVVGATNVTIRRHASPLYNSIFRFDDAMYVTPHLYGIPGSKAPLLHLKRREKTGIFERFTTHFDAVWSTTHTLEAV